MIRDGSLSGVAESQRNRPREVRLRQGTIRYRDDGEGEPLVFVHGLLVNGGLWRKVTPPLSASFRCIAPDWPLGSHRAAMKAETDLSPRGLARLVADFLAALDLRGVTLVGNDTGGALCQFVVTAHPERIARLVLTNCDAFDNFPPPMFRPLLWGARAPGFVYLVAQTLRSHALCRLPTAFGLLTKRPLEDDALDSYVRPLIESGEVRRDVGKVLRAISPDELLTVSQQLADFKHPVLVAWAPEDGLFPFAHAERLARIFPNARLEPVADSYAFVPEDAPGHLAELIADFMRTAGRRLGARPAMAGAEL